MARSGRLIAHARQVIGLCVLLAAAASSVDLIARPVAVRHAEGLVHGFLVLRDGSGKYLGDGDLIQTSRGATVTSKLSFLFKDGSSHVETSVFTQHRTFRLISYRLVQKGPAFPRPVQMAIDGASGRVSVRYADDDGEPKTEDEQMELPGDLANGLVPTLLKNVRSADLPLTVSYVAATPKPRLVKLEISSGGAERFSTGGMVRQATHYVIKVELGGLAGLVAPILGKEPPDTHVWILRGEAPAFVKSEGPFFAGGAPWRIELTSPRWSPRPGD